MFTADNNAYDYSFDMVDSGTGLSSKANNPAKSIPDIRAVSYMYLHPVRTQIRALGENILAPEQSGPVIPDNGAIASALQWVEQFNELAVQNSMKWRAPNVTSSAHGEVVFEWWESSRKLTTYIAENSAQFVKVWGENIHRDMDDGDLSPEETPRLWQWLMSDV